MWVESGVVLGYLRVRSLHRQHLTPALVLWEVCLVEIRRLVRSDQVLWVGLGLGGSEAWVLDWELLPVALSWVFVASGSPGGLLGRGCLLPRHI